MKVQNQSLSQSTQAKGNQSSQQQQIAFVTEIKEKGNIKKQNNNSSAQKKDNKAIPKQKTKKKLQKVNPNLSLPTIIENEDESNKLNKSMVDKNAKLNLFFQIKTQRKIEEKRARSTGKTMIRSNSYINKKVPLLMFDLNKIKEKFIQRGTTSDNKAIEGNFQYNFKLFKEIQKVTAKNMFFRQQDAPSVAYMKQCFNKKMPPFMYGILNSNKFKSRSTQQSPHRSILSDKDAYDIQHYQVGDTYASALSKGLEKMNHLQKFQLKDNRLTDKGMNQILQNISSNEITFLDLSNNKFGKESTSSIQQLNLKMLTDLNLENCNLGDQKVANILKTISQHNKIRNLNLANNQIGIESARELKNICKRSYTLQKLDLHWNNIHGKAAIAFFKGLVDNVSVIQLDISWNNLKSHDEERRVMQQIAKVLSSNEKLKHLDISNNQLELEQTKIISKGISKNQTLLGLHIQGNEAVIDQQGFITPMLVLVKSFSTQISPRIEPLKCHDNAQLLKNRKQFYNTNC